MKMKQIFLTLFILTTSISLAQNNSLSLSDAVQIALAHRYDLKVQKVNTEIAEKQSSEVITRSLPQITSDLDVRYNSQLQTNILPGSIFGPSNSPNREAQFGTKYNTLWGFNINQSIFNPNDFSDRKISNLQIEYQKQNEVLTEVNIKQEVTEAYFAALLWKERMKLSEENVKRAEQVYQVTQSLMSNGQATEYDVQRNKIDLENAKATDEQNKRSYELSLTDLLYKISTDSLKSPVLTDNITDLMQRYNVVPTGNEEMNRPELAQENTQHEIYNKNILKQELLWLPTLSVYGNYSLQYLSDNYAPFGSSNWYPFSYVGVKISFPIFDGALKILSMQEYTLRAEASQYNYDKLYRDFKQEVLSAQTTLDNAHTDLDYQKKNLGLIEDLYKIDSERLKNGSIKQSDLTTTYYTLQQTQTNYLNSVYNYLIAVVKHKKAIGSL